MNRSLRFGLVVMLSTVISEPVLADTLIREPTAAHKLPHKSDVTAQAHGIEGRQIAAPPWSAACMTDHGPSECGEPMWMYDSRDVLARYRSAF
ncbi:hypothetical protein ACFFWD_36245 [Bradyrhizobium erythrophlei]|uniref:hypothetical protein n=1 Tax=Bradyrhizobium erythrophlei TaxID=1437360 RepID=UPI0035EEE972